MARSAILISFSVEDFKIKADFFSFQLDAAHVCPGDILTDRDVICTTKCSARKGFGLAEWN